MKPTSARIAGITLLGLACLATGISLLSRPGNAQAPPPALRPTITTTAVPQTRTWVVPVGFVDGGEAADDLPPMQPGLNFAGGAKNFQFALEGRTLSMSMDGAFLNDRPDMRYVSWIRITPRDEPDTTVFRHVFEDHVIQAQGQVARGSMAGSVELPLPPGRYDLFVNWNGLPPGTGFEVIEHLEHQALEEHLVAAAPIEIR